MSKPRTPSFAKCMVYLAFLAAPSAALCYALTKFYDANPEHGRRKE